MTSLLAGIYNIVENKEWLEAKMTKNPNKYNESFKYENGILHVHLSGTFPNELLNKEQNLFQPLIDACSKYNCKKALIDVRDLRINFDTLAMFRSGEDFVATTRLGLRIALVAREEILDTFFDNVVYNRGGILGIFTDINDAFEWLQK
jgi:hypothetical protein